MTARTLIALLVASAAATACSAPQTYASGQAWQQGQCNRIIDMQERERCMAPTRASYDAYQRQVDAVKKADTAD